MSTSAPEPELTQAIREHARALREMTRELRDINRELRDINRSLDRRDGRRAAPVAPRRLCDPKADVS